MKKRILIAIAAALCLSAQPADAQQNSTPATPSESYRVYSGTGETATLDDIVAAMNEVEVVFIGEIHDDPTQHWIERELFERAFAVYGAGSDTTTALRRVTLSLEFFERDVQAILDEYLADVISERTFRAAGRPWPAYETDYRPLIEFAKQHGVPVIAANTPRRYANRVTRLGRESLADLSEDALRNLPPLPYGTPSDAYRSQWFTVMAEVAEEEAQKCGVPIESDSSEASGQHNHTMMANQLHTQVLWDATMAFSVAEDLLRHPGQLVLHMVGGFHVESGTGIPEHLGNYRPGTRRLIVSMRAVADIDAFDSNRDGNNENFVILTDESLTRSELECRTGS